MKDAFRVEQMGVVSRGEFIGILDVLPFAVLFGLHEHNLSSTRYHKPPAPIR